MEADLSCLLATWGSWKVEAEDQARAVGCNCLKEARWGYTSYWGQKSGEAQNVG